MARLVPSYITRGGTSYFWTRGNLQDLRSHHRVRRTENKTGRNLCHLYRKSLDYDREIYKHPYTYNCDINLVKISIQK